MMIAGVKRCQHPDGAPLTITTGTAEAEPHATQTELLGQADLALMTTKARNRQKPADPISLASKPPETELL